MNNILFLGSKATLFMLLCLISNNSFAQANSLAESHEDLKSQIQFSVTPILYQNLKVRVNKGNPYLKSKPTISGNFLVSYNQHLKKGFYINIGAGLGLIPYNVNYDVESLPSSFLKNEIDVVSFQGNMYSYSQWVYNLPISVQKSFYRKNRLFNIGVGVDYKFINDYAFTNGHGIQFNQDVTSPYHSVDLFYMDIPYSGFDDVVSVFLQAGCKFRLKKNNTVDFHLVMDFIPKPISEGQYYFYQLIDENEGTVQQRISNIGIRITYGLGSKSE